MSEHLPDNQIDAYRDALSVEVPPVVEIEKRGPLKIGRKVTRLTPEQARAARIQQTVAEFGAEEDPRKQQAIIKIIDARTPKSN